MKNRKEILRKKNFIFATRSCMRAYLSIRTFENGLLKKYPKHSIYCLDCFRHDYGSIGISLLAWAPRRDLPVFTQHSLKRALTYFRPLMNQQTKTHLQIWMQDGSCTLKDSPHPASRTPIQKPASKSNTPTSPHRVYVLALPRKAWTTPNQELVLKSKT